MKIFETHCHYEDEAFAEDLEEVLNTCREGGVLKFVNIGSSVKNSIKSVQIAKSQPDFYAAIGIHPEYGDECTAHAIEELEALIGEPEVVAVGEIGLDYHWDSCTKEKQLEAFVMQLELAYKYDMPIAIHSRDAAEDTIRIIKEYSEKVRMAGREFRCVIHCFSYSPEIAKEFVKMGCFIGVGGVVTFKNAKKLVETVANIPLESIVVETDCPYMAPEPHRGERNYSAYISFVCEKIAEIKGLGAEKVAEVTYDNALKLYNIV